MFSILRWISYDMSESSLLDLIQRNEYWSLDFVLMRDTYIQL